MPSVKAFVLGNGKSRLKYDLHELKLRGKVYGCNALFRDFTPDVLVATDRPMVIEVEETGYPDQNEFWTRNPGPNTNSKKVELNYGFSSGPIAVTLAAMNNHKPIYMIGFDLTGDSGMINNVYAGTPNYRPENDKETYWGNWVNQLHTIMKDQFPHSRFIRCVEKNGFTPQEWKLLPNYSEMYFEDFINSINNTLWQKQKE